MDVVSYLMGKQAGGGEPAPTPTYQEKDVTITTNTTTTIEPDEGYDALSSVSVTTNVPANIDLNDYFNTRITTNTSSTSPFVYIVKNTAPFVIDSTVTSLTACFLNQSTYMGFNFQGTDTSNITGMYRMFEGCAYLKRLDLSSFNTSNVTTMANMFKGCTRLAYLDISSFTIPYSNSNDMFSNMGSLASVADGAYSQGIPTIYVKDAEMQTWVISQNSGQWSTNNVIIKS